MVDLDALANVLTTRVADQVVQIRRRTGFPLYLTYADSPAGPVRHRWGNTNVALLEVDAAANAVAIERAALRSVCMLAHHASDLPIDADTDDLAHRGFAGAVIETVGMLRAHGALATLGVPPDDHAPLQAHGHAAELLKALERSRTASESQRLAALLIVGGVITRGKSITRQLRRHWPSLDGVLATALGASPVQATDAVWSFILPKVQAPSWIAAPDRSARVGSARVQPLLQRGSGTLASDTLNKKGFAHTVLDLHNFTAAIRRKPLIGQDHDRAKPPVFVVLSADVHCHGETHLLRAEYGALSSTAVELMKTHGGFSVGFHKGG